MGLPNPSRETKFSGANADREIFIVPVQLTTWRIDNLTRLIMIFHIYTCNHTHRTPPSLASYHRGTAQETRPSDDFVQPFP